mgnify:CR=1 FL=1
MQYTMGSWLAFPRWSAYREPKLAQIATDETDWFS